MLITTSPQSTRIHPELDSPSTPIILILFSFKASTSLLETEVACLLEFAVAIIISSANDDTALTSNIITSSALLSSRLWLHILERLLLAN